MHTFRRRLLCDKRIRPCVWLRDELKRLGLPTALVVVRRSSGRSPVDSFARRVNAKNKTALVIMDLRSNMEDLVARADRLVSEEGAAGVISATTRNLFFTSDREVFENSSIKALYVTHPPMGEPFARMTVLE